VAQVDTDAGFTNTASLAALDQTDPNPANNSSSVVVTPIASADLAITKTDGVTVAVPGSTVTYTITASNAGPSPAFGATVTDAFPAAITSASWTCVGAGGGACPAAGNGDIAATVDLPVGASVTFTATAAIDAGTNEALLSNTATVAPPAGTIDAVAGNNAATDTDTLVPTANLSITKTDGATSATPGTAITYTVVASNAGPSHAPGALVVDVLPAVISGASWTCAGTGGGTCAVPGGVGNVSATVDLPAGTSVTFTISGTIDAAASGTLSNTATVTAPAGVTDPNPGDDTATDSDTLEAVANLSISKTDGATSAVPGQSVTYTITAGNAGPSAVSGATITDALPAAITSATWTCVGAGGGVCPATGSGDIAATVDLPVGASVTFTVDATIDAGATGTLANTATIAPPTGTIDPVPGDNSATDVDTLDPTANLSISKTDGATTATPGLPVTYAIVAHNAGPSAVVGATVLDTVPADLGGASWTCTGSGGGTCPPSGSGDIAATVDLPVGASATFTLTGTVAAGASGSLSNTATIAPPAGTTDPDLGDNSATDTDTLVGRADIETHKDGPGAVFAGSQITYTVTVTNHGPSDANGTSFIDEVPAAITGVTASCGGATGGAACGAASVVGNSVTSTIAALPVGSSVTFTIQGTAPAEPTTFANTAGALPPLGMVDPVPENNGSTVATTVTASADVSIVKSAPASAVSGATIAYTLVVSNAGPSAAHGASYADAVPAAITGVSASCGSAQGGATCAAPSVLGNDVTGTVPTLPAGGSVTITISGTAPFGAQAVANTATVAPPAGVPDPDSGNNVSSTSTAVGAAADIALSKSVDEAAPHVGQTVTFTITATNTGPNDATGVAVTDSLPFGLGFVSATASAGDYAPATGLWTIGALADGETATLTLVATVEVPGALTNTVAVSASDQPDPDTSNNNAGASINAGATADIAVAKSVDHDSPNVGDVVSFLISVTNNGPNDATGVEVADHLPAGLDFVAATPSQGTFAGGVWNVGALAAGEVAVLLLDATVTAPGSIVNTATITHEDQFDPVTANNQAGASINGQEADLAVTKTVDETAPNVGDDVTFTVTVHNNGPSDATGVRVLDALPQGLGFVSATPSQGSYDPIAGSWDVGTLPAAGAGSSATLTVVAHVLADGAMTNTASIDAHDQPDPNGANNSASASLNGNPLADLVVTKTGPATVTPGDEIAYTIVVRNDGPSAATGVVVTDPTPAGLEFVSNAGACTAAYPCTLGTLADGASATITSTYRVPADYAGANPIVNSASAGSDVPDPVSTNNQSSASTNVGPGNADLAIVKTGAATVASNGSIGYTLTITNNGPSPANGASYLDEVPAAISAVSASCGGESGGAACAAQPQVGGNTVSGTIGTLPAGGTVVIEIIGIAPTGPLLLANTATIAAPVGVDDPEAANDRSTVETTVAAPIADLAVAKTGPADAIAGTNVTYTITLDNAGPDPAEHAVLADPTPAGLVFVSASAPCAAGFPCDLGSLAAGARASVDVTYAVDAGAAGTQVTNTVTASSGTPDPDAGNNVASASTAIHAAATFADLALAKSGPATAAPGDEVTYVLTVANHGPDPALDVVLSDPTPAGLVFVSAGAPCTAGFPCELGALASGAEATVEVTYAVSPEASGSLVNAASVAGSTPDPDVANNTATATTRVDVPVRMADLDVGKSGPAQALSGTTITYEIVVTNRGPDAVPDPMLYDPTPEGLDFVSVAAPCAGGFPCALPPLAAGASVRVEATYLVTPGFHGTIVNTASVASATVEDPTPNNNASSVSTVVAGTPVATPDKVPVDARWMLLLMAGLLALAGSAATRRRPR